MMRQTEKRPGHGRNSIARRGSTLGWVILVMMVIMILMMSALALSASHIYRHQRNHTRSQLNLTSLSVAGAIAQELEEPSGEGGFYPIMEAMLEDSNEGEVLVGGLDEKMGDVCLLYYFDGDFLEITVRTSLGKETGETKLIMRRCFKGEHSVWEIMGYGAENFSLDVYTDQEGENELEEDDWEVISDESE